LAFKATNLQTFNQPTNQATTATATDERATAATHAHGRPASLSNSRVQQANASCITSINQAINQSIEQTANGSLNK
jgi:hypothetical protein